HGDTRINKIGEVRELSANQVFDVDPIPFIADEQVLIGGKRLNALGEALDKIFGVFARGLASDCVHDAKDVLGAMTDFAHEEMHLFLASFAFCDVRNSADHAHSSSVMPSALEISKPMHLHPTDLAASPSEPKLVRRAPRIDGIKRGIKVRLNHFHVVRMDPLHDLLDRYLISGNIENLLKARIPRDQAADRIVPPPPEQSSIERKLHAIFACLQVLLRLFSC